MMKPVIEACLRSSGRWGARLASNKKIWEDGDDPYEAVEKLLVSMGTHDMPTSWEEYHVELLAPRLSF